MPTGLTRIGCRFTARGIVALVFSCIVGILGVAVVAWYGFAADVGEVNGVGLAAVDVGHVKLQPPASSGEDSVSAPGGGIGGRDEITAVEGGGAQK
jgi:iron transport multicopper oxidase